MPRTKGIPSANYSELGGTGLRQYGGYINEEFLRQIQGIKGIRTFTEMRDNDPIIGSILFIIDKLLRNVTWDVEAANKTTQAEDIASFVRECMNDMEHSWEDLISEVLSMLTYGFSIHEIVYKVRGGLETGNPQYKSKFDDNKVGWRKLPIRAQETITKWDFNESGDVVMITQTLPIGGQREIPASKTILFKTQSYKNNPQGRSILRNAYRPWFFKKRIEEVEGIGIERDLAGLPVAKVPASLLAYDAGVEEKATLTAIKTMISNIRRDEQEGVIFPLVYDDQGNELYKLELLSTGGQRQFNTSEIVTRYDKRIAMTVLADFIFLGQDKVGSFALSSDKTSMFSFAIGTWIKDICSVLNRTALPALMRVNAIPIELWPSFKPGDVEKDDVSVYTEAIYKLVGVGALLPDDSVDAKIRTLLGLEPAIPSNITPMDFKENALETAIVGAENAKNPPQVVPLVEEQGGKPPKKGTGGKPAKNTVTEKT